MNTELKRQARVAWKHVSWKDSVEIYMDKTSIKWSCPDKKTNIPGHFVLVGVYSGEQLTFMEFFKDIEFVMGTL